MTEIVAQRPVLRDALSKAREKGVGESIQLCHEIARARVARLSNRGRRRFLFVSPPLSNSGAPLILTQVVDEFALRFGRRSVRLLAPSGAGESLERLDACGIRVERAAEVLSPALVSFQLALRRNDFVLLNSAAVSANYLTAVLDALEKGRLAHAYWYVHEDVEHLPVLAPFLLEPEARSTVARLMTQGRLTVVVPSSEVKGEYDSLFENSRTGVLPFKVTSEMQSDRPLPTDHYESIRFLMSGRPTDGNKGHMIVMAAFHEFMNEHHRRHPDAYRPFTLTLVGMTDDDISRQLLSIGNTLLGERLKAFPTVAHDRALEITRDCNAVICCSFKETGPLYVLEGMGHGHLVLRSDAGGMKEQLVDGVNGFRIDNTDVRQIAGVIARVLDKRGMPESRLQMMGQASQELVARLLIPSYVDALEEARVAAAGN